MRTPSTTTTNGVRVARATSRARCAARSSALGADCMSASGRSGSDSLILSSLRQQQRTRPAIVEQSPIVNLEAIDIHEVLHADCKAPSNDFGRHVVATLLNPSRYADNCLLRIAQGNKKKLHDKPCGTPRSNAANVRMPRQRRLEREADAGGGISVDLLEHQAPRAKRRSV